MHFLRLLDVGGNTGIWSCKLFVTFFHQVLYIFILEQKYVCNIIYNVIETVRSRTHIRVVLIHADIPTSPALSCQYASVRMVLDLLLS